MFINDFNGDPIKAGDIVLFTKPGARKRLPSLAMGEVVKTTKAGVTVYYLNKDRSRVQREEFYEEGTGEFYNHWYDKAGQPLEKTRYVKTGQLIDKEPESVRYYPDRFIIVGSV